MFENIIKAIKNYKINKINRQNDKDEGIILPLTYDHGLEVIVRLVKLKHKFLAKKWQYSSIIFLLVIISSGLIWFQSDYSAKGATYGWVQSTWSGGADTEAVATHTDNQTGWTGWTKFFSKDSQINTDNNEIKLSLTSGSNTETDDASGFSSGTQDNTYSTGTGIALKKNNSVTCSADIQCTSGNCDTDFSSGSYCHATASSCAFYALGTPWERATGYEQCSGHSYFKSCTNSVWGSQQNVPAPAYCDAGGGTASGYNSYTCTSGMTGGFTTNCVSCSPYKANTTSTCKTSCSTDTDCWSIASCISGFCVDPCSGVSSVVYSGETYPTVKIGTRCWLAKNLNIGTRIAGTSNQTNNAVIEKYCYNNLDANCTTYGGLYQWNEAMQYVTTNGARGICPTGWHIPTDAEFTALETYLGADAGGKMKQTGTTLWASPNTGATNSSGFTGLPAGYRFTDGSFYYVGSIAFFWSSSISSTNAWYRYLDSSNASVSRLANVQAFGFSVRCIKD